MIEKLSVAVYVIFKVLGLSLCNIEGKVGAVAFNNLPTWLMATLRLLNSTEAGLRNGEVRDTHCGKKVLLEMRSK